MPRKIKVSISSGRILNRNYLDKGCSSSTLQIEQLYQLFRISQFHSLFTHADNRMDLRDIWEIHSIGYPDGLIKNGIIDFFVKIHSSIQDTSQSQLINYWDVSTSLVQLTIKSTVRASWLQEKNNLT